MGCVFIVLRVLDCLLFVVFCFLFLDVSKRLLCGSLAPIAAKILCCRGSAAKIVAESGTVFPEKAFVCCS